MEEHLFSQSGQPNQSGQSNQSNQSNQSGILPQAREMNAGMQGQGMQNLPPGAFQAQSNSPRPFPALMVPIANQVTGLATRLKLAEERYSNLSKRNQLTEESLLGFEKDMRLELKTFGKQLSDMRRKITEINLKLDTISGELGSVVRKQEFSVMEHYLDLWQPMQFVSRDEATRLIRDSIYSNANSATISPTGAMNSTGIMNSTSTINSTTIKNSNKKII